MWKLHFRRIACLVFLSWTLILVFFGIRWFSGRRVNYLLFKKTALGEMVTRNGPLKILRRMKYSAGNGDAPRVELLSPSTPDAYPTPRRARRGTPDTDFGIISNQNQIKLLTINTFNL